MLLLPVLLLPNRDVVLMLAALLASDVSALLRQARAELDAGRLEAAEHLLARATAQAPDSPEANLYLGITHFRMRRVVAAQAELERAVRLAPSHAGAWKALGAAFVAQQKFAEAEAPLQKACNLDPREIDACYYLARDYYVLNRFQPAIETYTKALKTGYKLWRVHEGMGLALEAMGRVEEAEQHLREAVAARTSETRPDEDPRIELGAFLTRQGRAAEALVPLQEAVKAGSPICRPYFELGRALSQLGSDEPAVAQLEKAIALDPQNGPAQLLLGKLYYRLGRTAEGDRHTKLGQQGALATAPSR